MKPEPMPWGCVSCPWRVGTTAMLVMLTTDAPFCAYTVMAGLLSVTCCAAAERTTAFVAGAVQLTTNNAVARVLMTVMQRLLHLAIFPFDGAFGSWRARLSARVAVSAAVCCLTNSQHGLLQLLHGRTHSIQVISVQRALECG